MEEYWLILINSVKKVAKFKKHEGGFYFFEGGTLSLFQVPRFEDNKVAVPFRFSACNPLFLDDIFKVITSEINYCRFSCSIRGKIDFTKLKNWVKTFGLVWLGETEETFSSILDVGGQILKLTAYPKRGLFNLIGILKKEARSPSNILKAILQKERMTVVSVRIPLCYKESYVEMAKSQGLSLSEVQRNALKMCLERFYRREIKKLMKI